MRGGCYGQGRTLDRISSLDATGIGIAGAFHASLGHAHVLGLMVMIGIVAAVLYGQRPQDRRSVGNTVALAMPIMTIKPSTWACPSEA